MKVNRKVNNRICQGKGSGTVNHRIIDAELRLLVDGKK